jgi:hypothetical protein
VNVSVAPSMISVNVANVRRKWGVFPNVEGSY